MIITLKSNCWNGVRSVKINEVEMQRNEAAQPFQLHKMDSHARGMLGAILPLVAMPIIAPMTASAAAPEAVPVIGGAIKDKIVHSFDPLIDLIQALSFPIAGVMIAGGCLFIMAGNRDRGMQMLQNAAIGYILVQLSPMMLDLLVGIGSTI